MRSPRTLKSCRHVCVWISALLLVPIATPVKAQQGSLDASVVRIYDARMPELPSAVSALGGGLNFDFWKRWSLGLELTLGKKRVGEQRSVLVSATTHLPTTYVARTTFSQSTFDVLIGPHWTYGPVSFGIVAGGGTESRQTGSLNYVASSDPPPADPIASGHTWLQTTFGAELAWRIAAHLSLVPKVRWQRTVNIGNGCCTGTQTHGHLALRFVF
jgi:hypothetical protein